MPRTRAHDLYNGMLNPSDPEFGAKVGSNMGFDGPPPYTVNPAHAGLIQGGNFPGLYGIQVGPGEDSARMARARTGIPYLQPDKVYGFGDNANQQVWAHEFRHRNGMKDEYTNRVYDAAFAGSEKQWNFAVDGYQNILHQSGYTTITRKEAELALIAALDASFPDKGTWQNWAKKQPETMLSPDRPKPLPRNRPRRSTPNRKK